MTERIPKARAARLFEAARLQLDRGDAKAALPVLEQLYAAKALDVAELFIALGDACFQTGDSERGARIYEEGRSRFPKSVELLARVGVAQLQRGELDASINTLTQARERLRRNPMLESFLGHALLRSGRAREAEDALRRAVNLNASPDTRIELGRSIAKQGRYAEAEGLFKQVEVQADTAELKAAAQVALADCRLFQGDAKGALALWKHLRADGRMDAGALTHMALAAQLCGEPSLADELTAERLLSTPTAEDRLLFAQIANLRGDAKGALSRLDGLEPDAESGPAFRFEVEAARGRALRLSGELERAQGLLESLLSWAESKTALLGPRVLVDLGRIVLDKGELFAARGYFEKALELDPQEPEAKFGLKLTETARAPASEGQAAAMKGLQRRVAQHDAETEDLRSELERLREEKRQTDEALAQARELAAQIARQAAETALRTVEETRAKVEQEERQRLRAELERRENETAERASDEIRRALGDRAERCPPQLLQALEVAERTFQKSLLTELPAAAVSVLYAGALERALFFFLVDGFRNWLHQTQRLGDFLRASVREKRGKRVEYFDRFVEAFDPDRPGKAPALGEVARVLDRRKEPYLAIFRLYLEERFQISETRLGQISAFVTWTKETLRDPVAHGQATDLSWDVLRKFRIGLLTDLAGSGRGLLYWLLG